MKWELGRAGRELSSRIGVLKLQAGTAKMEGGRDTGGTHRRGDERHHGLYRQSGFGARRRAAPHARAGSLAAAWLGLTLLVFQSSAPGGGQEAQQRGAGDLHQPRWP